MDISPLATDLAYFALFVLEDVARLLAGALIVAAFVDGLVSVVQIMRR